MSSDFTGYKNAASYYKGKQMPESEIWAILKAKKIEQIRGLA